MSISTTYLTGYSHRSVGAIVLQAIERTRVAFPLITFLAVTTLLLSATQSISPTVGSVPLPDGFVATTDTAPLEVAGESTLPVLGYVDFGMGHLYVTAKLPLMIIASTILAYHGKAGMLAGIILSGYAAGTLIMIIGCPCGSGSATTLWTSVS